MIVFFLILVVILIIGIAYALSKVIKDQKEIMAEEIKIQVKDEKKVQFATTITEENFEDLLQEALTDPIKMEILKRNIQNNLRNAIKNKNTDEARKCNMQLKRIDVIEKKGIQN